MAGRSDRWLAQARERIASAPIGSEVHQIGRVHTVADGTAIVTGLALARLGELVRFAGGQAGLAHALDRDQVGCVLLDDGDGIKAGDPVTSTGSVVRVPVGPELLGRTIDPLGRPLDARGPILTRASEPIERPAPTISDRALVTQPIETGIFVIDTMFAIGRGQRQLILGDRATGKTALAIDTIINQRRSDMISVYVAIGQRSSSVARVIEQIRRHGAAERCLFVVASPASPPGLQWLAPFTGFTIAEYFRDRGHDALVVVDDLTKHAATHREIALLTGQSPGREAYPGDIFYLHSRLLERAAKLSPEKGGGSLTALPIAETEAGNLSSYIPTNLISITDGQIVLDARLFAEGIRPAVDVGVSVSRIGGKTQVRALREASGTLRLDYTQFLELEMFSRFGEQADPRMRARIERGQRLRALLTQPLFHPLRMVDEVALALALQEGLLDPLAPSELTDIRATLPSWLDEDASGLVTHITADGLLGADRKTALVASMARLVERRTPAAT